ncbi:MAG: glycosyltransferase family 4 protein [Planctomycetes bacterium]|nr:glycosyltransferase family 4 protein [Planctomycetota bacterium]
MRVAIDGSAIGPERSGARTRLLNLLLAYASLERRHEIVLFCRQDAGLAERLAPAGIECVEAPPPPPPWRRFCAPAAAWRARLGQVGAHALQAETLPVPRCGEAPLLLTIHDLRDLEPGCGGSAARRLYARFLLAPALRRVACVIAVSESTRARVVEWLHVPPERVAVVANAADPAVAPVADAAALAAFRERFDLRGRFVLALGHVEPRKNLGVLVAALRLVRRRAEFADVGLVLAGRSAPREARSLLRQAAREEAVPLVLTGPIGDGDRSRAFSAAACLAIPSLVEGFGMVPLEAMRARCPVVAARRGALEEVVGDAALLFDARDAAQLARALERVLADQGEARRLVERGLCRAAEYDWSRSARALRAVHDAVCTAGAGR